MNAAASTRDLRQQLQAAHEDLAEARALIRALNAQVNRANAAATRMARRLMLQQQMRRSA